MNRRALMTMTLALFAAIFATALPERGFAQADNPLVGTWKLNLAKSKFSPGPPPKSQIGTFEAVGQGLKATVDTIDAQGNPRKSVFGPWLYDGKSYPITGLPAYDAASYKRINASTSESIRTKAGKAVQNTTGVTDGKTYTLTTTGVDENGQQINSVAVYEKQ
jgi:hypothetical protein